MKNIIWVGNGFLYTGISILKPRKRQKIKALKLMGVTYFYDY